MLIIVHREINGTTSTNLILMSKRIVLADSTYSDEIESHQANVFALKLKIMTSPERTILIENQIPTLQFVRIYLMCGWFPSSAISSPSQGLDRNRVGNSSQISSNLNIYMNQGHFRIFFFNFFIPQQQFSHAPSADAFQIEPQRFIAFWSKDSAQMFRAHSFTWLIRFVFATRCRGFKRRWQLSE